MVDIKRPNYFTYQFLVEADFNDEQAYHLQMRRRHNRLLHVWGVADGLEVTRVAANQVRIGVGTAIDKDGREIALEDARTHTLVTGGNNADVFLTISYNEDLDQVDHDTQSGVDEYRRTTERPQLQDSSTAPPADGATILLARIRLNATGAIEADASINASVRTLAGAKIAPRSIATTQLADGAVTLGKLATEVQPLAVQGANAITVVTDNVGKTITVGESHSAHTDNPHAVTAQQVDTQGGANRIVTQINAGTGIIAQARVETTMLTGVVMFSNLVVNQEQFSNDIDPGLGTGPLCVQFAFDDLTQASVTLASDTGYSRDILVRSDVNRTTGRFRIFAKRSAGSAGTVRVRWYAFRPNTGTDATVQVGVVVSPAAPSLAGNIAQVLTATVSSASNPGVTWTGPEANGGVLSAMTATTATYTSPGVSGTYHVTATSIADPTKSATATITVNAAITVILSQTAVSLVRGQQVTITGDVINTVNTGITWAIQNNAGGTLSVTSGASTTYTAPTAPGTYTVVATSVADTTKKTNCVITVLPVAIAVSVDANPIDRNSTTTVRATITPAGIASSAANWQLSGAGSLSTAQGPTTIYTALTFGATATVTGTSVSDPTKSQSVTITTNSEPPPPPPPPPPGKLIPMEENLVPESTVPIDSPPTVAQSDPSAAAKKARTFVRPQKRAKPRLSLGPSDE